MQLPNTPNWIVDPSARNIYHVVWIFSQLQYVCMIESNRLGWKILSRAMRHATGDIKL